MIRKFAVLFLLPLLFSCGGYRDQSDPLNPEQVQITEMATALKNDAAALQNEAPADLKETTVAFAEASSRFQNLCLRKGANSLESRKAFDKILFLEAQISQSPELQQHAEFDKRWQELRSGRLKELAEKLGYRPERM